MNEFYIKTNEELNLLLVQTRSSLNQCLNKTNELPKTKVPCSIKNRITFLKHMEQSIIDLLAERNADIK